MTEPARQPNASQRQERGVADYIVHRLAEEGMDHCFGVAGDYAFPLCDAVDRSPEVKWIGCANELNASYAADGYARIRGAAMLVTTYGVGELSALNGVMGAKAERSLVFHLVGMPSYQNQRLHKIAHHTLGDGVFGNFVNISAQAACCHAVITPENCMIEMERLIAEARRENQPAYIAVPSDFALTPVTWSDVKPVRLASNDASLRQAIATIEQRVENARSIVALPAYTLARLGLETEARKVIEALGCPSPPPRWKRDSLVKITLNSPACTPGRFQTSRNSRNRRGRRAGSRPWRRQSQRHLDGRLLRPARPEPICFARVK